MASEPLQQRVGSAVPAVATTGCLAAIAAIAGYAIHAEYARCAVHAGGESGFWCGLPALVETAAAFLVLIVPFPGVVTVLALRVGRPAMGYALALVPGLLLAAQALALAAAVGAEPPAVRAAILGLATAGLGAAAATATAAAYESRPGGRPVAATLAGSGVMLLGAIVLFGMLRS